jgi:hypothetical protein
MSGLRQSAQDQRSPSDAQRCVKPQTALATVAWAGLDPVHEESDQTLGGDIAWQVIKPTCPNFLICRVRRAQIAAGLNFKLKY